jgi:menaquinone-9 beta-reductase
MKNKFEVIVVGGGPAGSAAGIVLAGQGIDVLVLDKEDFPRFKLCGGMITRKTMEVGRELIPGYDEKIEAPGIIEKKNRAYSIKTIGRELVSGNSGHPFIMVNRAKYDSLWMDQLRGSGATLIKDRAAGIDIRGSTITTASGRTFHGKFIVGADGSKSRIRRALSRLNIVRPPGSGKSALALETFVDNKGDHFSQQPELYLGLVRDGYGWSFPGSSKQVVGICSASVRDGRVLKGHLLRLLETLGTPDAQNIKIQAGILPYGDFEKKPGHENVHLVGDAAGLAEPLLGEGIYYAHLSGSLSARAIIEYKDRPDLSCAAYSGYMKGVAASMRRRLIFRKLTLGLHPALADKAFRFLLPLLAPALEQRIQGKHVSWPDSKKSGPSV